MSNDQINEKGSHEFREGTINDKPPTLTHSPTMEEMTEHYTKFPNAWSHVRYRFREFFAEFFGTMFVILFGDGVVCQVVLSGSTKVAPAPKGEYISISFAWGIGVAIGVWISGGISGGHLNPAVTLALATTRRFPWKKVPVYMLAQLLGALLGAAIVYANYFHAIDAFEGKGVRTVAGTAGLFSTYAEELTMSASAAAWFDEFLGTAILLIGVLAITDQKNLAPIPGLLPVALFLLITGIGMAFGMQTGYAINPARDLGPRILSAMAGYGKGVFTFRNEYWIWCPVIAPFCGAIVGAFVYDIFLFVGGDSVVNSPNAVARAHHQRAANAARPGFPNAIEDV
ncbi:hypothetical protein Clacol_003126 [Clathrus columnatus]|uniref:Aquaporin n=1 Tax=Clathrus columnatus TaxID=1419009 RepID=A0AAV5A7C5_9AGAM|nr:hypothetical protein Clacol_003126 [Clathrus columnatus]